MEVVATESPDALDEVLRGADGRTVVVCGGDGSVSLAVARAQALDLLEDVVLGVFPLGTGNDLATHLRLPTDPLVAASALLEGGTRAMDLLAFDDDRVAVNAVHLGIGVAAADRASELKPRLGQLAYPIGALLAGAAAEGLDVEVTVDDQRIDDGTPVLMVVVANGPTIGGGAPVLPDARPDDGQLEVLVSHAVAPGPRAAFGVALRAGSHTDREDVRTATGQRVVIAGEELSVNRDGELDDPAPGPLTVSVEPSAWQLVVPPSTHRE